MKATFLFVGRNIDIYEEVIKEFSKTFNVISEKWNGITKQSKINSEKSNIIFCDGCQDNVLWYCKKKNPLQRIIVRIYEKDIGTISFSKVYWNEVNAIVFINEATKILFCEKTLNVSKDKLYIIDNGVSVYQNNLINSSNRNNSIGIYNFHKYLNKTLIAIEYIDKINKISKTKYNIILNGKIPIDGTFYNKIIQRINIDIFISDEKLLNWYNKIRYIINISNDNSDIIYNEAILNGCLPFFFNK